jgi:molybdate transport system substrate-binding protein
MRARRLGVTAATAGLVLVTACGGASGGATPASGVSSAGARVTGTVTVLAAASLTEAFTRIGKEFEAANPGSTVKFSFAGSSTLARNVIGGAPADVFASASPANVKQVTDAGLGGSTPTTFARNQLVIAVPKGNPKHVAGLAGLNRPGVKVALCADAVPCGAAAKTALAAAGVKLTPVTLEQDVKAALAKVKLGEVDAALVYRTDARSASSDVDGVEFAESAKAVNDYQIIIVAKAPNAAGAKAFVAYLLSDKARAVLTGVGFQNP